MLNDQPHRAPTTSISTGFRPTAAHADPGNSDAPEVATAEYASEGRSASRQRSVETARGQTCEPEARLADLQQNVRCRRSACRGRSRSQAPGLRDAGAQTPERQIRR